MRTKADACASKADGKLAVLPTAALMAPLSVGIIATSFSLRSQVAKFGRRLVGTGIATTAAGVTAYLVLVRTAAPAPVLITVPLLIVGLGMGCCFGTLFATALGDVDPVQAGSASGTLNALQQVANAIGAAVISTVFLAVARHGPSLNTVTVSLAVVLVVLVICAATVPLLPARAVSEQH